MGALTCTDRGKKGGDTRLPQPEENRRQLRIKKQDNTPDYELTKCSRILRNTLQIETTRDIGTQQKDEAYQANQRAFHEGLIVQDIIDQWKLKEKSVKQKLNRRPQIKKGRTKRTQAELSDDDRDEPSFLGYNESQGNMSIPRVTLGKIE